MQCWFALIACLTAGAGARRVHVVEHSSLFHTNGTFKVKTTVHVPKFDPGPEALEHLQREGYVVVRSVANASQIERARELAWSFLEGTGVGVRRDEPDTWHNVRPNQYGIVWGFGSGHSKFLWHVRMLPRLREMFELVWAGSLPLLSSFEGFSFFPPRAQEAAWTIADGGWFHTDQNGVSRPGLQTVQSLTSLWDQARD
jgi:hypothetical protein